MCVSEFYLVGLLRPLRVYSYWPDVRKLFRITSTRSRYKNCPENKLDRWKFDLEERECFQCEVSSQFGKQFNVLLFWSEDLHRHGFVNNKLFLRIVGDCVAAFTWMFVEVHCDKCTLRTSLVCCKMNLTVGNLS